MDKIIELKNVSFRYSDEETEVIKNLNLDFYEGQFTCVLGHNGSGKSTLAKLSEELMLYPQQLPMKRTKLKFVAISVWFSKTPIIR